MKYVKDFYFNFTSYLKDPQNGLLTDMILLSRTASFESWVQEQMYLYFEKHFRSKWELTEIIEGDSCYSYSLTREQKDESREKRHMRDLHFRYWDKNESHLLGSIELKLIYAHYSESQFNEKKEEILNQVDGKSVAGIVFGIDLGENEAHNDQLCNYMKFFWEGETKGNIIAHNRRQIIVNDENIVEAALSLIPPEYNGKEKRKRLEIKNLRIYSMLITCKQDKE